MDKKVSHVQRAGETASTNRVGECSRSRSEPRCGEEAECSVGQSGPEPCNQCQEVVLGEEKVPEDFQLESDA